MWLESMMWSGNAIFFDHRLRDHHELEEKTSYILLNPVRKELCERAEAWRWVYRPNDRSLLVFG
jgi:hypothetical protein